MLENVERDDPFGGAWGAALGVRAGDFVFTTVAGVERLDEGEPVFAATFEQQCRVAGEHLVRRLRRFGAELGDIVDATVWVHPSVEIAPGALLDSLQATIFFGVMPAMSFVRSPVLYPDCLIGLKVVAFSPRSA